MSVPRRALFGKLNLTLFRAIVPDRLTSLRVDLQPSAVLITDRLVGTPQGAGAKEQSPASPSNAAASQPQGLQQQMDSAQKAMSDFKSELPDKEALDALRKSPVQAAKSLFPGK